MPNNKKKRSTKKKSNNNTNTTTNNNNKSNNNNEPDNISIDVEERVERIFARCTIERGEEIEKIVNEYGWPPSKDLDTLPTKKQYPPSYKKVSKIYNDGLALVQKGTGITGLSRWHLVLEKMLDAFDVVFKDNLETQNLFLDYDGGDHRSLLCSIVVTISQMFQKMSLFHELKSWSKVAIAIDRTYFKGYSYLATAVTFADDDWQLASELVNKAIRLGEERNLTGELIPARNRVPIYDSIINAPNKKVAKQLKYNILWENRGVMYRLWQDMNITTPPKICNVCFAKGVSKCSKCRIVYYCSRRCQVADHTKHKHVCVEPSDEKLIDIIKVPNFPEDEIMTNDDVHWNTFVQHTKLMKTSLMMSACNSCILPAVKRVMMKENGNVNELCPTLKETPIMVAALRREPESSIEICRILIMHGACPNVTRGDGEHLLSICRSRAKWIDDTEPSTGNTMFRLQYCCDDDELESAERKESEELVQLITTAISQHKLCKYCKARKKYKGQDTHLRAGNLTDNFLQNYENQIGRDPRYQYTQFG